MAATILMNKAVFVKTMENVRNRKNMKLTTSSKRASKLINKPSFQRVEVFTENFYAVHMNRALKWINPFIEEHQYLGTHLYRNCQSCLCLTTSTTTP